MPVRLMQHQSIINVKTRPMGHRFDETVHNTVASPNVAQFIMLINYNFVAIGSENNETIRDKLSEKRSGFRKLTPHYLQIQNEQLVKRKNPHYATKSTYHLLK